MQPVNLKLPKSRSPAVPDDSKSFFMCPRCAKCYKLRHSLTRHMKFECGQEPRYPCQMCPKKFKHKYDLTVHMRGRHNPLKESNKENVMGGREGDRRSPQMIGHMIN